MVANQSRSMTCPRCAGQPLAAALTKQGVEVDHCRTCGGVWLDKGEIFYFARSAKALIVELQRAEKAAQPGDVPSPATGQPMQRLNVFGVELDMCGETGGLWLDKGEIQQVVAAGDAKLNLSVDETATRSTVELNVDGSIPRAQLAAYAAGMKPLPNLFVRSVSLLVVMYALLGALLIAAVEAGHLQAELAVLIGVAVVTLQFVFGPWIMDILLNWFYSVSWVEPQSLPPWLRQFIERVCGVHNMKFPRIGVIHDGAPNAFTYGHTPNNARIVITEGLYDLLEDEEVESVVAHEIGHAVQWDMLIMTAAQLVPLIAYYLYRTLIRMRSRGRSAGARVGIAIGAYIVYIVSEYLVLWLSRTREYRADNFSGRVTGNPNLLARALVKIGYGLASQGKQKARADEEESGGRRPGVDTLGALGIFDGNAARAFTVSAVSAGGANLNPDHLKGAMRWDLWNPWAKFYELHSTHPLIANRLDFLSRQAASMNIAPLVLFDEKQPESYWDEFFADVLVMFLPWMLGLAGLGAGLAAGHARFCWLGLVGLGAGMFVKTWFSYASGDFPSLNVAALLKKVKVSAVRGVACTLHGTVIGRGVPGLIWSEDFVIRDQTGIIFLDYRQPLRIWEFLFGLLRRGNLQGAEVVAKGWYRRAPTPYVELLTLQTGATTRTCYVYYVKLAVSVVLVAVGLLAMAKMH
jgi:Zn-dependent protease with chaperone function